MALLHRLLPRIRQTSPSVIALSLSLVSLGANAHSVSDVSTDTHAGQSVQSVRPEMGLPLPESCCDQIAQATGQPPATTGSSAIKTNRDSANALSDEAFEKMLADSNLEMKSAVIKSGIMAEKSKLLANTSEKLLNLLEEVVKKLNGILESVRSRKFDMMEEYIIELERLYISIVNLDTHSDAQLGCAKDFSIGMFQYGFAANPLLVNTSFVRDGKINPDKNRIQKLMYDETRGLNPCNVKENTK